jgi:hypothetical protein
MSLSVAEIRELSSSKVFMGLVIECPECHCMEDDQYGCTTCGCQGGGGEIEVDEVIETLLEQLSEKG